MDGAATRASAELPANVTLFQTRRDVWLLLLTGLKESQADTRVELMHAIAKKIRCTPFSHQLVLAPFKFS